MDIKRIFENNFDFAFKATTYNNINIAIKTFEQFTKDNQDFFSFDKRKTLFGYLRTYAIEKQFSNSAFKPNSNYSVYMKQVNKYQYKALYIETKDFILNIGRTDNANKLLPKSLYRKKLAKANTELNTQLSFDIENDNDNNNMNDPFGLNDNNDNIFNDSVSDTSIADELSNYL